MQDYSQAFEQCLEAAQSGDKDAQFLLGLMYGLGLGVAQDYEQALRWYRDAARQGSSKAQVNLGYMYGTGRGVPQDFIEAYAWYNVAATGGNESARKNRDVVAMEMSPAQVAQGQKLSKALFDSLNERG